MVLLAGLCTLQMKRMWETLHMRLLGAGCYPLQCCRHALAAETVSFFRVGNPKITFRLCIWRTDMLDLQIWQLQQRGKVCLQQKFTKSYSSALFVVYYSCHKPEHTPDNMNVVEKENTEWMFLKNQVISVWEVLRANVICITITQKGIFLVVSVSRCC